jgi:transcriptional regulator with XRE-family HTH domain
MPHLRTWREHLRLSRQEVVNRMAVLTGGDPMDQAALAKWEAGETAVRVEDLMLLARVYGTTPDRLFFSPADARTPEMLRRAHEVIIARDPEAVSAWLGMGELLPPRGNAKSE